MIELMCVCTSLLCVVIALIITTIVGVHIIIMNYKELKEGDRKMKALDKEIANEFNY